MLQKDARLFKQHVGSVGSFLPEKKRADLDMEERGRRPELGGRERNGAPTRGTAGHVSVLYASRRGRSWLTRPVIAGRFGWKRSYFWAFGRTRRAQGVRINRRPTEAKPWHACSRHPGLADRPRSVPPKIRLVAGGRAHRRKEGGAFARARGREWCVVWRGKREDRRRSSPPHADGRASLALSPCPTSAARGTHQPSM
jgi:hypothetical protein